MSSQAQPVPLTIGDNEVTKRVFSRSLSPVALVRSSAPTRTMLISMLIDGKHFNFNRKSDDQLEQVLSRMRISFAKALKTNSAPAPVQPTESADSTSQPPRKMKKMEANTADQPAVDFLSPSQECISACTLGEAVELAKTIRVEKTEYILVKDPPIVTSLELESEIWAGFPVVATWSCTGASEEEFMFEWCIIDSSDSESVSESIKCGQAFTPSASHVGHFLEVRCYHPSYPEYYSSFSTPERISEFPSTKASRLDSPLPETSEDSIRISTFNILAQPYIRTALAQDVYYTHLHKCWYLTEWKRRFPLILREMLDTASDIYCLQEVAGGAHELQMKRALSATHDWNFFGKECQANNGNPIGVAIAINRTRFDTVATHAFNMTAREDGLISSMLTAKEKEMLLAQFGEKFFTCVMKHIHTIAGVVHVWEKVSGKHILIANTHLFFHPFGGHIRILQGVCLMRKLEAMRQDLGRENGGVLPGIIACGDFNSRPNSGSFEVMNSGGIHANNVDWQYGRSYRSEVYTEQSACDDAKTARAALVGAEDDEAALSPMISTAETAPVEGIALGHGLPVSHVPSVIPELTHATAAFRSTLDYIFFSNDCFESQEGEGTGSSLPQFTNEEADRMGGLPFDHYGSDHVLVCGDIRFRK